MDTVDSPTPRVQHKLLWISVYFCLTSTGNLFTQRQSEDEEEKSNNRGGSKAKICDDKKKVIILKVRRELIQLEET